MYKWITYTYNIKYNNECDCLLLLFYDCFLLSIQVYFQNANVYIMTFLESFLLVGLSSQLSKLLIVYTEIVQLPKPGSRKKTVIGIITGTCKCLSCVSNLFCHIKFYSYTGTQYGDKTRHKVSTSFASLKIICFYVFALWF